jgi:hypothetical protein
LVLLLENRQTEECGVVYLIQTMCITIAELCLSESCPMMMMKKKVFLPPLRFWNLMADVGSGKKSLGFSGVICSTHVYVCNAQ